MLVNWCLTVHCSSFRFTFDLSVITCVMYYSKDAGAGIDHSRGSDSYINRPMDICNTIQGALPSLSAVTKPQICSSVFSFSTITHWFKIISTRHSFPLRINFSRSDGLHSCVIDFNDARNWTIYFRVDGSLRKVVCMADLYVCFMFPFTCFHYGKWCAWRTPARQQQALYVCFLFPFTCFHYGKWCAWRT